MAELTKSMEQYLETIHKIECEGRTASISDIADAMGVKAPSVTYVMKKLSGPDFGLVNYEKYNREVSLTPEGKQVAESLERTHAALRWFFEMIGLESSLADSDACELEHFVNPRTVHKLIEFAEWVRTEPQANEMLKRFRESRTSN